MAKSNKKPQTPLEVLVGRAKNTFGSVRDLLTLNKDVEEFDYEDLAEPEESEEINVPESDPIDFYKRDINTAKAEGEFIPFLRTVSDMVEDHSDHEYTSNYISNVLSADLDGFRTGAIRNFDLDTYLRVAGVQTAHSIALRSRGLQDEESELRTVRRNLENFGMDINLDLGRYVDVAENYGLNDIFKLIKTSSDVENPDEAFGLHIRSDAPELMDEVDEADTESRDYVDLNEGFEPQLTEENIENFNKSGELYQNTGRQEHLGNILGVNHSKSDLVYFAKEIIRRAEVFSNMDNMKDYLNDPDQFSEDYEARAGEELKDDFDLAEIAKQLFETKQVTLNDVYPDTKFYENGDDGVVPETVAYKIADFSAKYGAWGNFEDLFEEMGRTVTIRDARHFIDLAMANMDHSYNDEGKQERAKKTYENVMGAVNTFPALNLSDEQKKVFENYFDTAECDERNNEDSESNLQIVVDEIFKHDQGLFAIYKKRLVDSGMNVDGEAISAYVTELKKRAGDMAKDTNDGGINALFQLMMANKQQNIIDDKLNKLGRDSSGFQKVPYKMNEVLQPEAYTFENFVEIQNIYDHFDINMTHGEVVHFINTAKESYNPLVVTTVKVRQNDGTVKNQVSGHKTNNAGIIGYATALAMREMMEKDMSQAELDGLFNLADKTPVDFSGKAPMHKARYKFTEEEFMDLLPEELFGISGNNVDSFVELYNKAFLNVKKSVNGESVDNATENEYPIYPTFSFIQKACESIKDNPGQVFTEGFAAGMERISEVYAKSTKNEFINKYRTVLSDVITDALQPDAAGYDKLDDYVLDKYSGSSKEELEAVNILLKDARGRAADIANAVFGGQAVESAEGDSRYEVHKKLSEYKKDPEWATQFIADFDKEYTTNIEWLVSTYVNKLFEEVKNDESEREAQKAARDGGYIALPGKVEDVNKVPDNKRKARIKEFVRGLTPVDKKALDLRLNGASDSEMQSMYADECGRQVYRQVVRDLKTNAHAKAWSKDASGVLASYQAAAHVVDMAKTEDERGREFCPLSEAIERLSKRRSYGSGEMFDVAFARITQDPELYEDMKSLLDANGMQKDVFKSWMAQEIGNNKNIGVWYNDLLDYYGGALNKLHMNLAAGQPGQLALVDGTKYSNNLGELLTDGFITVQFNDPQTGDAKRYNLDYGLALVGRPLSPVEKEPFTVMEEIVNKFGDGALFMLDTSLNIIGMDKSKHFVYPKIVSPGDDKNYKIPLTDSLGVTNFDAEFRYMSQ